jgi:NTP pyrophosphatase (non-canonical NTP hydrolase)
MARATSAELPVSYQGLARLQREFDEYQRRAFPARSSSFFALELCGEAGELANLEKKAWKGRTIDAAELADEAADVVIAVFNYANSRGIDLSGEVARKMALIEERRQDDPERA